jgi:hypothetical protein
MIDTKKTILSLVKIINKLYHTIKNNLIYIFLSLAIPSSLYYVGQGKEIVEAFFLEDRSITFPFLIFSFYMVFYSIWVVPTTGFKVLLFIERIGRILGIPNNEEELKTKERDIFSKTVNVYNTGNTNKTETPTTFPIRYLANLPLILFLYLIFIPNNYKNYSICSISILALIYIIVSFLLLDKTKTVFEKILKTKISIKIKSLHRKNDELTIGIILLLFVLCVASFFWRFPNFRILSLLLLIVLLIINNSFHSYMENNLSPSKENFEKKTNYLTVYYALLFVFIFFFYLLSSNQELHRISPVIIANIIISLIIIVLDSFLTSPLIMASIFYNDDTYNTHKVLLLKTVTVVTIGFLTYNLIFSPLVSHPIRAEAGYTTNTRKSLVEYYSNWLDQNNNIKPTDTIVLVAGQGGGSRAGAWMLANLDIIDKENIFAISTVSGSSNGANNYIYKKLASAIEINPDTGDSLMLQKLYGYNYLSESFFGFLFRDAFKFIYDKERGRNYYHQEDEMNAFKTCYDDKQHKRLDAIIYADFIDKWYQRSISKNIPLLFTNSATTQGGQRAISAPIKIDSNIFTTAIDVYEKFHYSKNSKMFLSHTAVNISQSFPFSSAYTHLDGVGNFIDGGLYDNSGTNTLYEIYHELKKIDTTHIFKIIIVMTSPTETKNTEENRSLILSTIKSVAATPFTGHSNYWVNHLKETIHKKDTFEIRNLADYMDGRPEVPLGIYLSSSSVANIYEASKKIKN